jgi:hypothetical protein
MKINLKYPKGDSNLSENNFQQNIWGWAPDPNIHFQKWMTYPSEQILSFLDQHTVQENSGNPLNLKEELENKSLNLEILRWDPPTPVLQEKVEWRARLEEKFLWEQSWVADHPWLGRHKS